MGIQIKDTKLTIDNLDASATGETKRPSSVAKLGRSETQDFANRLSTLLDKLEKISPHAFAIKAQLPVQSFYKYFSGISEPTRPVLNAIINASGVNPEWLINGTGPMMKGAQIQNEPSQFQATSDIALPFTITNFQGRQVSFKPDPKLIHIPVLTLEAACGIGTFSDNPYITAMFSATREWLTLNLRRNPDNLCLIHAVGDSMTDTIKPNDMVFVDPEAAKQPSDGIWVYSIEEQIFLKRLQFLPKQKLKVISDNPSYETYTIPIDESFKLLARYIAVLNIRT
ncbi:MAG: S24 family peptidase [Pusillimonas sp.]